jgi:hypothetical protein
MFKRQQALETYIVGDVSILYELAVVVSHTDLEVEQPPWGQQGHGRHRK